MEEKLINDLLLAILNKKPANIEVCGEYDPENKFLGFAYSELDMYKYFISTAYDQFKVNDMQFSLNKTLFNWIMALINYLKENKLLDDFKKYYIQ